MIAMKEYNEVHTSVGVLIPKYESFDARTKYRDALSFYESGKLKSIYLEKQIEIESPIGRVKAEMITFYEDGAIHRIFPLYGQLSGFWSEEEEYALAENSRINLEFIELNCKISCYCFYNSGKIKSLTFWKNEKVNVNLMDNIIEIYLGISFYENGKIKSIEPFKPTEIKTKIGTCFAYDNKPIGIHGDNNSLCFNIDGSVQSFITSVNGIVIEGKDINKTISPILVPSLIDLDVLEVAAIKVKFENTKVTIIDANQLIHTFNIDDYQFSFFSPQFNTETQCSGNCSNCNMCN